MITLFAAGLDEFGNEVVRLVWLRSGLCERASGIHHTISSRQVRVM